MNKNPKSYRIEPIVFSDENTVVTEFLLDEVLETAYQSEAELEKAFIKQLREQA